MSEATKRLVLHLDAADLPDHMRGPFDPAERVQVIVEADPTGPWASLRRDIERFHRDNPGASVTSEDAVARVRALRDEWD